MKQLRSTQRATSHSTHTDFTQHFTPLAEHTRQRRWVLLPCDWRPSRRLFFVHSLTCIIFLVTLRINYNFCNCILIQHTNPFRTCCHCSRKQLTLFRYTNNQLNRYSTIYELLWMSFPLLKTLTGGLLASLDFYDRPFSNHYMQN